MTQRIPKIEVRESTLPEVGGLGLFARRGFLQDDVVCRMTGELIDKAELDRRFPTTADRIYITQVAEMSLDGFDMYLDSTDPRSCYGRYINSLRPDQMTKYGLHFNVYFREPTWPGFARWFDIVALCKIEPGEELFADYGPDYTL